MLPIPALSLPTKILILLAMLAGAWVGGWVMRGDHEAAAKLEAERAWTAAVIQRFNLYRKANAGVSADLAGTRAKAEQDRIDFDRKLRAAHGKVASCAPAAPAGPVGSAGPSGGSRVPDSGVSLTRVGVGLWHDALATGIPVAYPTWRADADATAPDTVGIEEALANLRDNAKICNDLRAQVIAWQKWSLDNGLITK